MTEKPFIAELAPEIDIDPESPQALVTIVPARRVEIVAPVGDPVQGDGDILAVLPARIEMAPDRLQLVARR